MDEKEFFIGLVVIDILCALFIGLLEIAKALLGG